VAFESAGGNVADGGGEIRINAMENSLVAGGDVEAALVAAIQPGLQWGNPGRSFGEGMPRRSKVKQWRWGG
jgi:hypothetical protein